MGPSRRGFGNRLRRDTRRKLQAPRGLRPQTEMDNFSYSHRCTSDVRLWLGARSVLLHQRVPLPLVALLFAPFALAFPKVMLFVVPNLCNILRRPAPMLAAVHSDLLRGGNLSDGLPSQ